MNIRIQEKAYTTLPQQTGLNSQKPQTRVLWSVIKCADRHIWCPTRSFGQTLKALEAILKRTLCSVQMVLVLVSKQEKKRYRKK